MMDMELKESLKDLVFNKSELKQNVFQATKETFSLFRNTTRELIELFQQRCREEGKQVAFEFTDRGDFEFEAEYVSGMKFFETWVKE